MRKTPARTTEASLHQLISSLSAWCITGLLVLTSSACSSLPGLRVNETASAREKVVNYKVLNITPNLLSSLKLQQEASKLSALPSVNSSGPVAEYKVGPGDVLQIIVWDNINLTNPFGTAIQDAASTGQLIDSNGHLNFPYVGSFAAAGMTIQEIRRYVSSKLITIKEPQVDVRVVAFRSHRVQVTGEVNSPGVVTLDDTVKGVLEALNERGGLNANASRRVVLLIRDGLTYQINLASLLSGQTAGANPLLVAGDIIQIPDNRGDQIFVMGEINSAGPIVIGQQNLSLSEALAKSGGLDKLTAEDSGVLIFRRADDSNSVARIFGLDVSNPGGMLLAGEFILNPSDVVYIKATNFSQYNSFISQILPTVTAAFQIDSLFQ